MEVVTATLIGMLVATGIGMGLKATLNTRANINDCSEVVSHARETVDFLEALIRRASYATGYRMRNFLGSSTDLQRRGICFFADLDDDRQLEWVWIWRDEVRRLNGDSWPYWRRHAIKVAAFRRAPPPGFGQDNFGTHEADLLYAMINNDPRCHLVIASHASQFQILVDETNAAPPHPCPNAPSVRVDAGFFVNNSLQSSMDFGFDWNQVSPGSTFLATPPPSVTLTRYIEPRSLGSTISPVTPNGGLNLVRPMPPTTNETTLRNNEINYVAAITNNPRSTWMLRPR
jgi:hypothetical protein